LAEIFSTKKKKITLLARMHDIVCQDNLKTCLLVPLYNQMEL